MLSFIGVHFPDLVVAAMSLFAGVMLFITIEEYRLARRDRLTRRDDLKAMTSEPAKRVAGGMAQRSARQGRTNQRIAERHPSTQS